MADTILYCTRCWREQLRKAPLAPCRVCGGLAFEPKLDVEKRDQVLAAAWPLAITPADHAYVKELHIDLTEHPKETPCKAKRKSP